MLVSELGTLDLEAGDFVRRPVGHRARQLQYLIVLSAASLPLVAEATAVAEPWPTEDVDRLRQAISAEVR
jgi:hypothetical protein